jgi:hypothetical protein
MTDVKPQASLAINVNDVVQEKQKEAEAELKAFFCSAIEDFDVTIDIVVTGKFSEVVGVILRENLGVTIPYNARHSEVVACGKTIPYKRENHLAFYVVFDASVFGKWEDEKRLDRILTFSHEKTHVEDDKMLCDDLGLDVFLAEPTTAEGLFFRLAYEIWMEYNAERYSIEVFTKVLKELHSGATVNFNLHEEYIRSFARLLKALPIFLQESGREFMNWKMTIDKFWSEMYLRLRETLVLAAFTAAHSDALGKINEQLVSVRQNEDYSFFFDIWKFIESELRMIYKTGRKYDKAILNKIAESLRALYERCGATLSNTRTGIYVAVHLPTL